MDFLYVIFVAIIAFFAIIYQLLIALTAPLLGLFIFLDITGIAFEYIVLLVGSLTLCYLATRIIRVCALRFHIIDAPDAVRKLHTQATPLLGGVALFFAFITTLCLYSFFAPSHWHSLIDSHVTLSTLIGISVGALILTIGGIIDDCFSLPPHIQILWPIAAALSLIFFGVHVPFIRNPFSGDIYNLSLIPSSLITFFWVLGIIYTTKILDGLDGLVTGITGIGAGVIALISFFVFVNVPTGMIALVVLGGCLGFLPWNSYPAKIFLGEAGSTLCGYFLAVLALISGAKFATGLLILAIPLLDLAWVIFQRIVYDKRIPFYGGDRRHLHFKLLELGLSHQKAVWLLYACSFAFGMTAVAFQNITKMIALAGAFGIMALFILLTYKKQRTP